MFLLFAPNSRMDGELNEDDADVDAVFYGGGGGQALTHRENILLQTHTERAHGEELEMRFSDRAEIEWPVTVCDCV